MKKKKYNGLFSYVCDKGRVRITNEDQVKGFINSNGDVLLCVADGMGGHKKGDYASKEIVDTLGNDFHKKRAFLNSISGSIWLQNELRKINKNVFKLQDTNEDYRGMGSTICCAMLIKRKLIVVNAGDSRCYIVKDGKLGCLTHDDTYVNYLIDKGEITPSEALTHPKRHYITNAAGIFPSFSFDLKIYKYNGEKIFLCSDGLYNNVSFKDIEANLNSKNTPEDKVHSLVNLANYNGGSDNISCILWESYDD